MAEITQAIRRDNGITLELKDKYGNPVPLFIETCSPSQRAEIEDRLLTAGVKFVRK